jgi:hypothetical protein
MEAEQTHKKKNMVVNLIVLVVAGFVAFNLYQKFEVNKARLNSNIAEEKRKSEVLDEISKTDKSINAYKKLLNKKDASLIMATVTNMAKGFGIQVITVKPAAEMRQAEFIKYPFVLTVTATSYHAFGKFISALESSKDVYIVDGVDIASGEEDQGNKLLATITISTIALTD